VKDWRGDGWWEWWVDGINGIQCRYIILLAALGGPHPSARIVSTQRTQEVYETSHHYPYNRSRDVGLYISSRVKRLGPTRDMIQGRREPSDKEEGNDYNVRQRASIPICDGGPSQPKFVTCWLYWLVSWLPKSAERNVVAKPFDHWTLRWKCETWNCGTWKCGTALQGWKMRDMKMRETR